LKKINRILIKTKTFKKGIEKYAICLKKTSKQRICVIWKFNFGDPYGNRKQAHILGEVGRKLANHAVMRFFKVYCDSEIFAWVLFSVLPKGHFSTHKTQIRPIQDPQIAVHIPSQSVLLNVRKG